MIKNNRISILAMGCVLCTVVSGVSGAPSVRSFGGPNTYSSSSDAVASNSAINSVRAASVGSTPNVTGVKPSANTVRAGSPTTSRLSVGSYLNSGTSVSGGSSIKTQSPGSSVSSNNNGGSTDLTAIQNQINAIKNSIDSLQDSDGNKYTMAETDSLLNNKQDNLTAGDGIKIENGVISATATSAGGDKILLESDGSNIRWKHENDANWTNLVALSDLAGPEGLQGPAGPQGERGEKGDKGEDGLTPDLSVYSTTQQMNEAISNATTDMATNANVANALSGKADKSDTYTKTETDSAINDAMLSSVPDLSDYAKTADVNNAIAGKANTSDVYTKTQTDDAINSATSGMVTSADIQGAVSGKADKSDTYTKSETNYAISVATTDLATNAAVAGAINTAVAGKVNTSDLGNLAYKDSVATSDIVDANVTKPKLAPDVQSSLGKADTALQPGEAAVLTGAPADGSDYVLVVNDGQESWFKVAY